MNDDFPPLLHEVFETRRSRRRDGLVVAAVITGIVKLGLTGYIFLTGPQAENISFGIGMVIGSTFLWPLIIIGLFSIAKRFRTTRTRAIILLVVWGLFILGGLGELSARRRVTTTTLLPDPPKFATSMEEPGSAPVSEQLFLGKPARPSPAVEEAGFDFSPGSDKRFIASIERAQQERYAAVRDAYADACARRPHDAGLALERVNFIARFAYSDDVVIESASDDLEVAVSYLTTRFPNAPGTVLYQLGVVYGEEFETKARAYAASVNNWPATDRAKFFLLRARAAQQAEKPAVAQLQASQSFAAEPTSEAGILVATAAHERGDEAEALRVLSDPVFEKADIWVKKAKMDLLFDLKRTDLAMEVFEQIKAQSPLMVQNGGTAMRLARNGRVAEARELFSQITPNEWNQQNVNRERFAFELEFGSPEEAGASYRAMRAQGVLADPLLRDRAALFAKHPGAGWAWEDLVGGLILIAMLLAVALAPLCIIVPVHYWSMWRTQRGTPSSWPGARWGLREVWVALGVMWLAESAALWVFQPALILSWFGGQTVPTTPTGSQVLSMQVCVWLGATIVLTVLIWRAQATKLLGSGEWSLGRAIGLGLVSALALRMALGVYVVIWPAAAGMDFASLSPLVQSLATELLKGYGPVGLVVMFGVFVPVLEELIFRGVLLQAFAKHIPFGWANVVQAALFAAVHENYLLAPYFFAFGLIAGLLTRRSGGLLAAIFMHATNNLIVSLGLIIAQR